VASRVIGGILTVLLTTCLALIAPGPTPTGPQLSITIDDGRTTATAGTRLTYTITVQNLSGTDITGLGVTQSVPPGSALELADSSGGVQAGYVRWSVNLGATVKTALHSTVAVYDTSPDLLRLTSVACAGTAADAPPIVCATHSDQLPVGAAAHTATSAGTAAHAGRWYLIGGLVMLSVAALMALLLCRRWTRQ
jgi:uncharacterized repeat protein (TIGR01451 family)